MDTSLLSDHELITWMNETVDGYRLQEKTTQLWVAILRAFDEAGPPMTVRQVYYALVAAGVLPKTESAYDRVGYHLLRMRRCSVIPYHYVADNTRWMRKPRTYTSLEAYLQYGRQAYRRALWANQEAYIEIWCEKDALAGVLYEVTEEWDVPLMVTRGFPSETFVYEAAQNLKAQARPVHIYYYGDYDPSGVSITVTTRRKLEDFGAVFDFEQVAVLPWQIEEWALPTRPTKKSDSRAKNWKGGSVELDAIPPRRLRLLVEDVIAQHMDPEELEWTRRIEEAERETLDEVSRNFRLASSSSEMEV
jgi:hypothetical protein